MKILNLFAGIGGNRSLWGNEHRIVAVDNNKEILDIYSKRFPNDETYCGDAYEFLENFYKNYDFIWASPPCPTHSKFQHCQENKKLPDMKLYSLIVFLQHMFWGKWLVENVEGYYKTLIKPTIKIDRHLFWSNFPILKKDFEKFEHEHAWYDAKKLSELKGLDYNLIKNIPDKLFRRKLVRNMVRPEIGRYILDCIREKTLENFIY